MKSEKLKSTSEMSMLKAELIIFLLLLLPVYIASAAGNFNCNIMAGGSCGGSNATVLYMSNDTGGYYNAHAQNVSVGTYPYAICCDSNSTMALVCGEGIFLKLNATTNTHVQRGDYAGPGIIYDIDACVATTPGYFNCTYADDACPADRECFASMASSNASANNDTDAHVGPCDEYTRKVCCKVVLDPLVTYVDPTPDDNARQIENSVTINVTVTSDPGASVDTCILEWKVGAGAAANETMEKIGSGSSVTCNITKATADATNYTFQVYANDSSNAMGNETARTFRENDEPDKVVLLSLADGTHTTDRTPAFEWLIPDDADGDTLNYTINISCFSECGEDPSNNPANTTTNSTTLVQELKYFGDDNHYYNWSVRAWDGYEYGPWSDEWNLTIDTDVSITMLNDTVEFGENRMVGYKDNTTDNDPYPFSLRNIGNCMINVNVTSSDLLWDSAAQPSDYFNYSVNWLPGEEGAFNWTESQTAQANMPEVEQNITFIDSLNYTAGNSSAEIELYIQVPPAEPPGTKASLIIFTSEYHR